MSIHGQLKTTRFKIFNQFRNLKTTGLLVCTDVMARGIDIADIDWVFQFDAPSNASQFVHRCGRTARIGNRGTALALLLPNEEPYVHFIDINQKVCVVLKIKWTLFSHLSSPTWQTSKSLFVVVTCCRVTCVLLLLT